MPDSPSPEVPPPGAGWAAPGAEPTAPAPAPAPAPTGSAPPSPAPGYPAAPGYGPPGYPAAPGYGPPGYPAAPGYAPQPMAPKPGVIPLRPLGLGEILDGSFTTIRRYPAVTLGVSALFALVTATLALLVNLSTRSELVTRPGESTFTAFSSSFAAAFTAGAIATALLTAFATYLLTACVIVVVSQAVLGAPVTWATVWAKVRPRARTLLGAAAVVTAVTTPLQLTAVFVLPGLLLAYVLVVWCFVSAAVVLEDQPFRAAFRRSRALAKGDFWRILGVRLLAGVIAGILSTILVLPFAGVGAVQALSADTDSLSTTFLVLVSAGQALATTIVTPFSAGVIGLLYVDRRMRTEALDLTLARAAAQPPPTA